MPPKAAKTAAQAKMTTASGTIPGNAKPAVPEFPSIKKPDDIIPANRFTGPYRSVFTQKAPKHLLDCLSHVNCSYLGGYERAPTLLELKQHAHSLAVLIRELTISTSFGAVNGAAGGGAGDFQKDEAYDWLNDLQNPYENQDPEHSKTLTTLTNQLEHGLLPPAVENDRDITEEICPMQPLKKLSDVALQHMRPLATHEALAKHANEILERLDHEFSSAGGVLGMLPMGGGSDETVKQTAENSFLGQWIGFTRALVLRCHELERGYANALDVLAGEAFIPKEVLCEIGAIGRQSHPVSHQQDHFIICNSRDNMWPWLNSRLLEKEGQVNAPLTWVEVPTNYYRLRGQQTVFVVPQWEGNQATRDINERPTVVQVVKPKWGDQATVWEEKFKEELARLRLKERELAALRVRYKEREDDLTVLVEEKKQWEAERQILKAARNDTLIQIWEENAMKNANRVAKETNELEKIGQMLLAEKKSLLARRAEMEKAFTKMQADWHVFTGLQRRPAESTGNVETGGQQGLGPAGITGNVNTNGQQGLSPAKSTGNVNTNGQQGLSPAESTGNVNTNGQQGLAEPLHMDLPDLTFN